MKTAGELDWMQAPLGQKTLQSKVKEGYHEVFKPLQHQGFSGCDCIAYISQLCSPSYPPPTNAVSCMSKKAQVERKFQACFPRVCTDFQKLQEVSATVNWSLFFAYALM